MCKLWSQMPTYVKLPKSMQGARYPRVLSVRQATGTSLLRFVSLFGVSGGLSLRASSLSIDAGVVRTGLLQMVTNSITCV